MKVRRVGVELVAVDLDLAVLGPGEDGAQLRPALRLFVGKLNRTSTPLA
jgi:hypothetical protein